MAKRKKRSGRSSGSTRELEQLLSYGPQHPPYSAGWTSNRLLQVQAFRLSVYMAVDAIASAVASRCPNVSQVVTKEETARDNSPAARQTRLLEYQQKVLTPLLVHESLRPVKPNHPLVRLFKDPNTPDTGYDLWYETVMFLYLTGTAYWWVPPNDLGLPESAWVLPSHWVWPVFNRDGHIENYELRPTEGNYYKRVFPADEIVVIRKKSPFSKIDGYAPIQAITEWVDTQDSVAKATKTTYDNGTFPTVAVQFSDGLHDPTPEQLTRIERKFLSRFQGVQAANRPIFLPPGVKLVPLSIQPNQMLFGETGEKTCKNILAAARVPPVIAGYMDGISQTAIVAAQAGFGTFCLNPLCEFLGQVFTEKLARRYDKTLRVWWTKWTPDDPQQVDREIKTDLLGLAITPDEIRMSRGREPFNESWSCRPVKPSNMEPANEDGTYPSILHADIMAAGQLDGGEQDPDSRPDQGEKIDLDPDNKKD